MSHKANTWAWEQDLPALQKIVLLALADRHNADTGRCDPSIKRVAENCGMSHRSVQSAIRQLTAKGLITPTPRRSGEKSLSNLYTLNLSAGLLVQDVQGAGGAPMQDVHQGGAGRAGGGVQDVHQGVQDVHPNL